MDSLISAAARALAAGDALAALQRVALRDDPPALALRGIAMAQLGEPPRARDLLRRAARGFGTHEPVARARCVVAEAEVALAQRDLGGRAQALMSAGATLQAHGDIANALQARLVAARTLILLGKLDEASAALAGTPTTDEPRPARVRGVTGLLRPLIAPLAGVEATPRGFVLRPHGGRTVAVLAPPVEGEQGALVGRLVDGAAWFTSALALALGDSQRTVQRALAELEATARVRAIRQA